MVPYGRHGQLHSSIPLQALLVDDHTGSFQGFQAGQSPHQAAESSVAV
jgi:hypothetical protein